MARNAKAGLTTSHVCPILASMPELVRLYRVFAGAPSDVEVELGIIGRLVAEWNRDQGPAAGARIEFTNWRTHSRPAAGARPQALLNKQLVDNADIVIGVFRSRFGSPTGAAESGTEEEIRRGMRRRKPVMVYFEAQPKPRGRRERQEFARIESFKRKLGSRALYHTYTDVLGFEEAFRRHLAAVMNELLARRPRGA